MRFSRPASAALARALAFVLLCGILPQASGTGLAGGFERVTFYYIYRAAVLTYGKDQDKILPKNDQLGVDCSKGTHKNGGCNFVEFISQVNAKDLDPQHVADSGIDLDDPDPIKAAQLCNKNKEHTRFIKLKRLHSNCPADYDVCIKKILEEYKAIHKKKEAEGNHKQLTPFDKNVRKATDEIKIIREGETLYPHCVDDFEKKFGVKPEYTLTDYPNDPEGKKKICKFDIEATIAKNPSAFPAKNPKTRTKKISAFVTTYGKKPSDPQAAIIHYRVLYAWSSWKNDLIKWCNGVPK